MSPVAPVSSATATARTGPQGDAAGSAAPGRDIHRVAKEFEALMVHQLLEAAKLGGEEKDTGYKGMVVDAAANGISEAGGLGLARQIEEALTRGR